MSLKDQAGNLTYVTTYPITLETPSAQTTLELIKQGMSADDVIKLKNMDLL
jgi:hypothetical protein